MRKASTRETRLVDMSRLLLRYLKGEMDGQHDKILLGRRLHALLLEFDDYEPCHDGDHAAWLLRQRAAQMKEQAR